MTYRRRHRWLRRLALGLAFAAVVAGGRVSAAAAKPDEGGGTGSRYVSTQGWSGLVDESGIPLSAGIPSGDEQYVQATPSGDELAFRSAIASQDPYLTDVYVRQGESLGGPDGAGNTLSSGILGVTTESPQPAAVFIPGVTDFPKVAVTSAPTRPDDRADRFTGAEQSPVIRPDDRADRFAHSDVAAQAEPAGSGWNVEWNEALSVGVGALVLVLAFGLGVGYLRRPRIAL